MDSDQKIATVPLTTFLKHSFKIVKNPLPFHHKNFEEKGDIFCLNLGFITKVYFCRDANFAEYVLQKNQKNYTKSKIQTKDLVKYVGKGLLTSEGEHWRKQRKLIQPAFHKKHLETLLDTIQTAIQFEYQNITENETLDIFPNITENETLDIFPILNNLAFQTVVKSLFSSAVDQDQIARLQYITEAAQKMLVKELRQPYLRWWFNFNGTIKKYIDLTLEARQMLKQIVKQRQESGTRQGDLLDLLLEAQYDDGSSMEEEQLIDEILILFTAGHETTSNALTFTFQLLAQHPEWQDKIYDEISQVNAQTTHLMERVMASRVCQQVIEESMRLYPPAYFLDRVNKTNDSFNGFEFKAGSNLLFSVFEIHRHSKYWDDPDKFLPERFADGSRTYSSHYFPFGAGPRKCIGNNFAMFEMIIAVRELISNYYIKAEFEEIDMTPLITLKPKNALLRFKPRDVN
ncbi:cytochrome P450 [Winogradskyella sp.]|uniref:cytochrome P450 n=1 Tax=Winogradskyella sp. TaxID=1883156 RepID=UPI002608269C|nr:cytochrome P450 [Winogradskyella sp.]